MTISTLLISLGQIAVGGALLAALAGVAAHKRDKERVRVRVSDRRRR